MIGQTNVYSTISRKGQTVAVPVIVGVLGAAVVEGLATDEKSAKGLNLEREIGFEIRGPTR